MSKNKKQNQDKVKIAIVDSGIEAFHAGVNGVDGGVRFHVGEDGGIERSNDYGDCVGHGTACAGIIRKKAPDALLYSVRIFDESLMADGQILIAAIQWCIDNQMDVVNLSLGTTDVTFKVSLLDICQKASEAGLVLVAAESNDGRESYPAVFEEVIGVTGGAIYEMDGFYYRKGQSIECVARGDEQRVCWLDGKHIMTSGTSFAAPHITGIVARLLKQSPNASIQNIRKLLQEKALKEKVECETLTSSSHQSSQLIVKDDYSWIQKAALYPYNKEMHSLVRYRDMLGFELVGVGDPVGKGMVGKDAGEVIDESFANLRVSPNVRQAMANADTLILGYVDQLARIRKRDLLREYVQIALDEGRNVFCFQELDPAIYGDLYELADQKGLRLVYPHIQPAEVAQAIRGFRSLSPVDVPVLAVMGTSSQQGKFTLQMALRRQLIQAGYRVGQLGTEHHARLLGMDMAFPMGYASTLKMPLQSYVPYLDYKMREICQHKRPDIILTGSQSGTIPYDVMAHSTHTMSSLAFLLGVKPDACILVVNSIDAEAYVRDTIDGIRAVCKAPTLLLAMGDREKHVRMAYGRSMITPQKMSQSDIAGHLKRLEDTFQLPAVEILSDEGQQRIVDIVVEYFSTDQASLASTA